MYGKVKHLACSNRINFSHRINFDFKVKFFDEIIYRNQEPRTNRTKATVETIVKVFRKCQTMKNTHEPTDQTLQPHATPRLISTNRYF